MAGKIPYYVSKDFSTDLKKYYDGSLGGVEKDIENSYKTKLMRTCKREKEFSKNSNACDQ